MYIYIERERDTAWYSMYINVWYLFLLLREWCSLYFWGANAEHWWALLIHLCSLPPPCLTDSSQPAKGWQNAWLDRDIQGPIPFLLQWILKSPFSSGTVANPLQAQGFAACLLHDEHWWIIPKPLLLCLCGVGEPIYSGALDHENRWKSMDFFESKPPQPKRSNLLQNVDNRGCAFAADPRWAMQKWVGDIPNVLVRWS